MGNDLECQSKTRQRTACLKLSISSTYIKKMVKKNPLIQVKDFVSRLWNYKNALPRSHWGRTRDTAFLTDEWFVQGFHTTVAEISWLLLIKPPLLTSWSESMITMTRKKQRSRILLLVSPNTSKEAACACFSVLFVNTQLSLQNMSPQAHKRFSQFRKAQMYHF